MGICSNLFSIRILMLMLHKRVQNHKFSNKINHLPAWRDFKINFSKPLFTIIFRPKIVFLDSDSDFEVKNDGLNNRAIHS